MTDGPQERGAAELVVPTDGVDEALASIFGDRDPEAVLEALPDAQQRKLLGVLAARADAWELTEVQRKAESLSQVCDELLYGGAAGGGKSEWLLWHVAHLSLRFDGHHSLVLRSSFPELRRSLIRRSIVLFSRLPAKPVWRAADKEWRFPNGSIIEFGYAQTDDDVGQYLSSEYDCIAFDELTEFTDYQYEMISSRNRTTVAKRNRGVKPHVIGCTNPGQRGHEWVKDRFVVSTGYGERTYDDTVVLPDGSEVTATVGFCPAKVTDNPHMDKGYVANLMRKPEQIRRQYLEGDWDIFAGMYFPEFQRTLVVEGDDGSVDYQPWHVVEPFEIPAHWPRLRAGDFGFSAPAAWLWLAFEPDTGRCYVYRELYVTGLTAMEQAARVLELSRMRDDGGAMVDESIQMTMLDPACWHVTSSGESLAAQYLRGGLVCRRADNARVDGWVRLREWMQPGSDGRPMLQIFSSCQALLKEMASAIYDKNRPEDLDTTKDDHALDALRYGIMSRPLRTARARREPTTPEAVAAAHFDRVAARGGRRSMASTMRSGDVTV